MYTVDETTPFDAPELAFDRAGSGEPLLLIHALGASRVVWEPVMDELAAHHEVLAVDMPGFGDSPLLPDGVQSSPRNLARACVAFAERQGFGVPAHVAGISLGGWVSIECARIGAAASVTGLCPAGFWGRPLGERRNVARALARLSLPLLGHLSKTPEGRRRVLQGVIHHPERMTPEQAVRLVRAYATSPGFTRSNSLMRNNVVSSLEDITVPITLAWAEHDRLVTPPRPGVLPRTVRQVFLPGSGHVPTWDSPELVTSTILETTGALELSPA